MVRVKRFWENAGLRGILVVIVLVALVAQDIGSGQWIYTVPLLVMMFLVTNLVRDRLVENLEGVRTVMNALSLVAILAAVVLRRFVP